jgi:predicted secreted protein
MATHTGNEGTIKVGSNAIAEVRSYSIEETGDTVEDTVMGDTYRTHKASLKSWTASADIYIDETDTTGQGALTVGSEVTLNVYYEGETAGDSYKTGTAIVTASSLNASFDGMLEGSISLQGTGALTSSTV